MIYPTNLPRAFAVVCSRRILKAKIVVSLEFTKIETCFLFNRHQQKNCSFLFVDCHSITVRTKGNKSFVGIVATVSPIFSLIVLFKLRSSKYPFFPFRKNLDTPFDLFIR